MRKISVLHIGKYYYPYRGGFEKSIYSLIAELKSKLHFTILVANTSCVTVVENDADTTVIRLACLGRILSQPIVPSLFIWLKKLRADIIHLHLQNPLAMFIYLCANPPGALVISYHSDVVRQKWFMPFVNPFLKLTLKKAHTIVVTSENLINSSPILNAFREKCVVIPHGVDVNAFKVSPRIVGEAEKIKSSVDGKIVLFVGRLVYYKGLQYLIDAMRDIDATLIVVGDGPLRASLQRAARIRGVQHKIHWRGDVDDDALVAYYQACSVFVLPSCYNSESYGIVILEAHALGKPVVSTDLTTGVTFTNLQHKTGLVVPVANSRLLNEAINRLLGSKELCEQYGKNGKERLLKEFTQEKMAQKYLTLYNTISNN